MSLTVRRVSLAENMSTSPPKPRAAIGSRHVQALLQTLGFLCCYAMRVSMSVAVVAMSDKKNAEHLDWDEQSQNLVLSAFFWGYVVSHIPGGIVAQRWGAQRMLGVAIGLCAIGTVLIPTAARHGGVELVCCCRVFMGFCQGVVPPILHTLLAKWVPLQERGRFASFVYSGGWIGNVIALQSSGLLAYTPLGWSSCFYFWGVISFGWAIVWQFLGKESPAEHTGIAADEKLYIDSSLGIVETTEPVSTPWKSILTSRPVWALLVIQCTQSWGFWMLLSKIPSYMDKVLQYDLQSNGLVSSLPYLCGWLTSFPMSFVTDWAIRENKVTVRFSRMFCSSFGSIVPAIALASLGFVDSEQKTLAVAILIIAVTSNVAIFCGHHVNHMDLSPNFAGPLMGFTNAAANICSILAPLIQGVIVKDATSTFQWRSIFLLTSGMYIIGNLAFLLFGSVKVQNWNDPATNKRNKKLYGFPEVPAIPESLKETKKEEKIDR